MSKSRVARNFFIVATLPVVIYLELRERFEHTDWKW